MADASIHTESPSQKKIGEDKEAQLAVSLSQVTAPNLHQTQLVDVTMFVTPAYDDRTAELRELDATLAGVRGIVASGATHVPRIFRLRNPEQQLRAQEHPPSATVPVIDLGGDHAAVVDAVGRAASERGFFQVTGHGVPEEAMAAAVAAVRAFHEADGGEGRDKARLYSRESGKAVKYHCNFDLYQSPVANWRDALYLRMAPDPPASDELPVSVLNCLFVCLILILNLSQ